MKCRKCGMHVSEQTDKQHLERANPVGEVPAEWECFPACGEECDSDDESWESALEGK